MRPLSQIELRRIDQQTVEEFGLPGVVLMENAGRGCVEVIRQHWSVGRCLICCGSGNNAGDGFVIARHLQNSGWDVLVRLAIPPDAVHGDSAVFLASITKSGLPVRTIMSGQDVSSAGRFIISWEEFEAELLSVDLVVDALLGTGLNGEVRSPYRELIHAINQTGRPVLSVDLPSGMDCNTGKPQGACIQATRTATMVSMKLGFEFAQSRLLTGPVDVIDIGIPQILKNRFDSPLAEFPERSV